MTDAEDNAMPESDPVMEEDVSSEGGRSGRSDSDGGTDTHPYRAQVQDPSFPRCYLIKTSTAGPETYLRSLFMLGHGTPVWDPVGDLERPQWSLESGVMIGDVGLITDEGDFLCYFNIFLPPENEMQRRCPPGFVPLHPPPTEAEIAMDPMYFPPGTALVSKAVSSSVHSSLPLDITFTIEARESGILVLPDGASREDLISTSRLSEYVQQHALDWYVYLNEAITRLPFPNGSLYIITGYDKATRWAVGTSGSKNYSNRSGPIKCRYQDHKWLARGMGAKVSSSNGGYGKCAVFIRGMHIAVSVAKWTASILYHQPPAIIHYFHVLSLSVTGLRARLQNALEARSSYEDAYVQGYDMGRMFHPTEVLLRVLLSEDPSADVAIAEDSMWCGAVVNGSDFTLSQIIELISRVLQTHEISSKNGLATFVKIVTDSKAPSTSKALPYRVLQYPKAIGQLYRDLQRRRSTLSRIDKVFPGPKVPNSMLRRG